jgi:DNA gyrase subunit A
MAEGERIVPINIEDEMKTAYIDYSMSVIVSRALPDVRDGLKPVHRRVLYGMSELGLVYNRAPKKSARIVGEVLGKYHPHGDSSVYDAMVRMAQDWSLRYPLVNGQGNFGSMDGDSPAAMRYTEARLQRISDEILADIDKDTVDFALNFDDTLKEPVVMPTRIPNLLINGASGIAVGMATNMLPHNLTEVIDGIVATLANPEIDVDGLMQYIQAPDFPTGGIIQGVTGIREAYETGRGRVVLRGKCDIQTLPGGRERIIISEIPFQVNKASMIIKMADLVNDKKIEGISDIRDESDRNGLRVVVEIKREAMASVVLSKLYKFTPLQTSYGINNIALVGGRPMLLSLKQIIEEFIKFRLEVIVRRTQFDLNKALDRAHILEGLLIALDYLDQIIAMIRASKDPEEAKLGLMRGDFLEDKEDFLRTTPYQFQHVQEGLVLTDVQAKAILEMRLQRLTGLERDKIKVEYEELLEKINYYREILANEQLRRDIVHDELLEVKEKFGDARRTSIEENESDIRMEDLIADDDVVITISHLGYIKRTLTSEYRVQSRGGKGSRGSKTRDEDYIEHMFSATNHNYLLLFTESGRCHWLRVFDIPEAQKSSAGRVIQNILALPKEEKVRAYIILQDLDDKEFLENNYIVFCTRNGIIKKTKAIEYSRPRVNGINALNINEGDRLIEAKLTNGTNHILLANKSGNAIRFPEAAVRSMGRGATGVIGIRSDRENEEVVGMMCIDPEDTETKILVISGKGYAKRTPTHEYRITNRGGKGIITLKVTDKTGDLVAVKSVIEDDQLMITSKFGIVIRMAVSDISTFGRNTQGVRVFRLNDGDEIADVTLVKESDEEELAELSVDSQEENVGNLNETTDERDSDEQNDVTDEE